ncbi:VOC family protein [Aestuariivita sp.]|jgi:predicted enzyme related to lactoylglutathione lyase|uniref:VOC family protein n=1 Tax=Aestuariivita sp. TaxID=1872407 RepID=UPI00216B7C66|nr:VOC family protein [Aestuariivita sp.]MCE8009407.1 VOC family protein [Aestuariivita sp.]
MNIELDHLLWAVPDLDAGAQLFDRLTGVASVTGGSHPGFGTRNALSGLSDSTYIELIAPDPAQDLSGTMGEAIAALPAPKLFTFALKSDDLSATAAAAQSVGVSVEDPIAMSRTTPEGVCLDWSILRISDARWPGRLPFFIDWQGSPHPAATTPGGCTLEAFYALDPEATALAEIYAAIGCPVPVHAGASTGFVAQFATPNGTVVFT